MLLGYNFEPRAAVRRALGTADSIMTIGYQYTDACTRKTSLTRENKIVFGREFRTVDRQLDILLSHSGFFS